MFGGVQAEDEDDEDDEDAGLSYLKLLTRIHFILSSEQLKRDGLPF